MNIKSIDQALASGRFETARRLCVAAGRDATITDELKNRLAGLHHTALRALGAIPEAMAILQQAAPSDPDECLTQTLDLAEDFHLLSSYDFFRGSTYAQAGMTGEEYEDLMKKESEKFFKQAVERADSPDRKARLAATLRRCRRKAQADQVSPLLPAPLPVLSPAPQPGTLSGTLRFPDGSPASLVTVTLGLTMHVKEQDPATYLDPNMHYELEIGPLETLTTRTDTRGQFRFNPAPAGCHEFLSVTLDPDRFDIHLRFLAQGVQIQSGRETTLNLTVGEWTSAPPREFKSPFPDQLERSGSSYRRVGENKLRNPFHYDFPRQELRLPLPPAVAANPAALLLLCSEAPDTPLPFQCIGDDVLTFTNLPALSERVIALYQLDLVNAQAEFEQKPQSTQSKVSSTASGGNPIPPSRSSRLLFKLSSESTQAQPDLTLQPEADGRTAVIDTGRAQFRLPYGTGTEPLPPLLAVKGMDGVWRGQGRLILPAGLTVLSRQTTLLKQGPLLLEVDVTYHLSDHSSYTLQFTAHRDEAYLLAREISPPLAGAAFEFSLRDFTGGRGFLNWSPEAGSMHWSTLDAQDRLLARLQEQTPWWIPPQGFGYAMTGGGLDTKDYIGVFTIRRGDWIDREFERLSQGPGDTPPERRELDWPYPEMVGSTISMITAHTTAAGDAYFRFGFFNGERHWGILVSDFDRNDGAFKELGTVQHKTSSPRLNDFKEWRLDEQDHVCRPFVVAQRSNLIQLRRKQTSPVFAPVWKRMETDTMGRTATAGLMGVVGGDPVAAWRRKREIAGVAHIRSRMTLLGRDFGDMYSPVGARPITPWAEDYDLIAATGAFTPDEERLVRSFLMLMGHLYVTPDFMNWKFNSRNANFEADRVDVVGGIGLVFHGNPDADDFVRHATRLMEKSIMVYSTPDSGKWYENPACYYLHASKCRMNLAFHLASHGLSDPTLMPRLKDYLRWGILLLTPECPSAMEVMRDGTLNYGGTDKVRRIAPVGDHAQLGPWVPEHYALMSKLYRRTDPEFADLLLWAYLKGGSDGGYFGNLPLFFSALSETDLTPPPAQTLASRRLQGFGAIFRGEFNSPHEFYLLFKQGPGGYRYHRTEGSLILFADGKPLIYDGGERGETWRHSTLSFHDVHMPLAPGHVERFHSFAALDFCQGVHPKALEPGEPIFLNDLCNHELEAVAYARYAEPNPADMRSVLWVKDDYVILHDDLHLPPNLPTSWHLQVVSDAHEQAQLHDYRFRGRFGTDLQVILPDQEFLSEKIEPQVVLDYPAPPAPRFTMEHLQLDATSPDTVLAVLRPMPAGTQAVKAQLHREGGHTLGVNISGTGIQDDLFLGRAPLNYRGNGMEFTGRYGAVIRRPGQTTLALIAGTRLSAETITLESDGPAATLCWDGKQAKLSAEGQGTVTITGPFRPLTVTVSRQDGRVDLML